MDKPDKGFVIVGLLIVVITMILTFWAGAIWGGVKEERPIVCEEVITYSYSGQMREICYNEGHHYTSLEYSVIRQWKENE